MDDINIPINASSLQVNNKLNTKPYYLIEFVKLKEASQQAFICIDKPDSTGNMLITKGWFTKIKTDKIISDYQAVIANLKPEDMAEVWFPYTHIQYVRNLVFRTNKK